MVFLWNMASYMVFWYRTSLGHAPAILQARMLLNAFLMAYVTRHLILVSYMYKTPAIWSHIDAILCCSKGIVCQK